MSGWGKAVHAIGKSIQESKRNKEKSAWTLIRQNGRSVENGRFESCRHAGILISGLFERVGSSRLCILEHKIVLFESIRLNPPVLRAATQLESLSRVSLRESGAAGFAQFGIT